MILHSNDRLPFVKYRGIQLGMIYLLAPSYVDWMVLNTEFCVGDPDFLSSLKVIDLFGDHGYLAHHVNVDREEIDSCWSPFVSFEDLKFSGFKVGGISQFALERNSEKLFEYGSEIEERPIVQERDREIFLFYPNLGLNSELTKFTPTGHRKSSKGKTIISFDVDNQRWPITFLPHQPIVRVASFTFDTWRITERHFNECLQEKRPIEGRIKDGYLELGG